MRAIVVGIDFLNESLAALKMAVMIAQKANSQIIMVFVNKMDKTKPIFKVDADKLKDEVKKRFKDLIEEYAGLIDADKFTFRFREGKKVSEVIHDEADDWRAELIVLGTQGSPGLKLFKHSLAFNIVEESVVPVITVRDGAKIPETITRILIPIDDSLETRQKVPFSVRLAKLFGAEVHMLAIYHSQVQTVKENVERYTRQSAEYLEGNNINFVVKSIETANVVEESIKYANEIDADIMSIMTVQIGAASNIWKGSYAEQLIDQSPIPVITVPPKELLRTLSR
jgi:nucleotide-binding universal stress UspA family protein